jgi:hypothetical protein
MNLPVIVSVQPLKETQTPNSGCFWLAEAEIDGRHFEARSRHGAPTRHRSMTTRTRPLARRRTITRHAPVAAAA